MTARKPKRPAAKSTTAKSHNFRVPPVQEVMEVAFNLSRELSLALREEELVETFAHVVRRLLPDRWFCLCTGDSRSQGLHSMLVEGPGLRETWNIHNPPPMVLRQSAFRQTRLTESALRAGRVRIGDDYQSIFVGGKNGFSVPLVASGELLGMIYVEYPRLASVQERDEPLVILLANQLSVALRNLSLWREARYYQDYLRQVIDVANALIVVVDFDEKIAVMNSAMQRYCGLGPDVIGSPLSDLRRRSIVTEPRLGSILADGLKGREYSDCEVNITREDGTAGRAVFNTSVLRRGSGKIEGVIAIGQDRERILSLERQVVQAEKLATLGQLAAGIVHELNNPLTSIRVYGDYLVENLEHNNDTKAAERARRIVDAAERIRKFTRDLMVYARPGGDFTLVALSDVIRQSLAFCEHVVDSAGAELVVELEEPSSKVRAIPTQLHQVMINLVTNACHAFQGEGQRVTVRSRLGEPGFVILEVTDTGRGIPAANQAFIFDPFYSTKEEGKGTGLGLSIVKNIVERHGGTITFRSEANRGTTFVIALPLA